MRGPLARAFTRPLVLAAAASAIPLVSAVPAAADSIVVGGFPVDVSVSPWTVALSSRDRFGVPGQDSSAAPSPSTGAPC